MDTLKALYLLFRGRSNKREKPNYKELLEVPQAGFYTGVSLEEEIWFYGFLRNDETAQLFEKVRRGTFLVRKMQTYDGLRYVISVKGDDGLYNVLVNRTTTKGLFWVDMHAFHTIQQLVAFYVESLEITSGIAIRVKMAEGEKMELVLKVPAKRIGWQIDHEQIELTQVLGGGAFGEVHKAVLNRTFFRGRKEVAVKTLRQTGLTNQQKYELLREADTMKKFDHENVIVFYGVAASIDPFMIAMEYCAKDSVETIVKKEVVAVGRKVKYLLHAAQGIHYLHTLGIVHGDLAARNCLVSGDDVVKITDFGLSVEKNSLRHKNVETPFRYWAPELIEGGAESRETDVYAYSVMIFELFHKCAEPFGEFVPRDNVPQAIKEQAIELYLFDRPSDETWPCTLERDIGIWKTSLEKPASPTLCVEITHLFVHCRYGNTKFRAAFPEDCEPHKRSIIKYWKMLIEKYRLTEDF